MRKGTITLFFSAGGAAAALACSSSTPASHPSCTAPYDAILAASSYLAGGSLIGGCRIDGGSDLPFKGLDLGGDPALAGSNGRFFYIARDKDFVFELDPSCATPRTKLDVSEPSHVGSANAQDVAVASNGELWIPRFNVPTLLVLDASGNRPSNPTIDLSSHDPDGNPNASAIRIENVGGAEKAFVALERLDDKSDPTTHVPFVSRLPSTLLRIDVATKAVEAEATLLGRDPFGVIDESGGAFFFAAPGNFDAANETDAGIERFDPVTFTTTYLLAETVLGASALEVAVNGACGAALVADPTHNVNATSLITFDAEHGAAYTTAANPLLATAGFDLAALAWRGDALFVGDRRASSGGQYPIHVFDRTADCTLVERADSIFVTQKPVALRATAPP